MPENFNDLVTKFRNTGPPKHYERTCLRAVESKEWKELLDKKDNKLDKTRAESASAKGAGIWLTQWPSEYLYVLTDNDVLFALRHRLGLPPHEFFPKDCPFIATCKKKNIESDHCHNCRYLRGGVVTDRHNFVVDALGKLVREIGCWWWQEPRVHDRRTGGSGAATSTYLKKARPDALCSGRTGYWMIDVSIINPTAPSYRGGSKGRTTHREKQKHGDYDAVAKTERAVLVPYVLESYGTVGKEARTFIRLLGKEAADSNDIEQHEDPKKIEKQFVSRALRATSFALQRGNAHVSGQGCARMRAAPGARSST